MVNIEFKSAKNDTFRRFFIKESSNYIQGWFDPRNGEWCIQFKVKHLVSEDYSVIGSLGGCIPNITEPDIKKKLEDIINIVVPNFQESKNT